MLNLRSVYKVVIAYKKVKIVILRMYLCGNIVEYGISWSHYWMWSTQVATSHIKYTDVCQHMGQSLKTFLCFINIIAMLMLRTESIVYLVWELLGKKFGFICLLNPHRSTCPSSLPHSYNLNPVKHIMYYISVHKCMYVHVCI